MESNGVVAFNILSGQGATPLLSLAHFAYSLVLDMLKGRAYRASCLARMRLYRPGDRGRVRGLMRARPHGDRGPVRGLMPRTRADPVAGMSGAMHVT
jgi:hypothetical protein